MCFSLQIFYLTLLLSFYLLTELKNICANIVSQLSGSVFMCAIQWNKRRTKQQLCAGIAILLQIGKEAEFWNNCLASGIGGITCQFSDWPELRRRPSLILQPPTTVCRIRPKATSANWGYHDKQDGVHNQINKFFLYHPEDCFVLSPSPLLMSLSCSLGLINMFIHSSVIGISKQTRLSVFLIVFLCSRHYFIP